jgi:hypothetical protein
MTTKKKPKTKVTPWQEMSKAQNALWQALTEYDRAQGAVEAAEQDDATPPAQIRELKKESANRLFLYYEALSHVGSLSEKFDNWYYNHLQELQAAREKSLVEIRKQIKKLEAELAEYRKIDTQRGKNNGKQ